MIHIVVIDPRNIVVDSELLLGTITYKPENSNTKITCNVNDPFFCLQFTSSLVLDFVFSHRTPPIQSPDARISDVHGHGIFDTKSMKESTINEHHGVILDTSDPATVYGSFMFRYICVVGIRQPLSTADHIQKQRIPIFIGHRGSGANSYGSMYPENTIKSFNHAMQQRGVVGIELDVSLTADRKLVVFHDLENGCGIPLCELTYNDLCTEGSETNPPLLEEVLRSLQPSTAGMVIELKYVSNSYAKRHPEFSKFTRQELVETVLDCLESNWEFMQSRWLILSSFDPDICLYLRTALSRTNFFVVHNLWLGHEADDEDNTVDFNDIRNHSWNASLAFSRGQGLALEAGYALSETFESNRRSFPPHDTLLLTYGRANLQTDNIRTQIQRGVNAFFIDDMKLANN